MGLSEFLLLYYILLMISLAAVFKKAGVGVWKAFVPVYQFMVCGELVGRKPSYGLLILIPIVNIFIFAALMIDLVRSFKVYEFWHHVLVVVFAPIYLIYLSFRKDLSYQGPVLAYEKSIVDAIEAARIANDTKQYNKLVAQNPFKKSPVREWAEAIIFAVFAATFIRMFLIEAFVIPTSSMEGSLVVGDFLFVSKGHYGIRMPQTIAMLPLLHNRIPVIGGESYIKKPQLKYQRLPALETIDRNDPVVFNYPEGDSVYVFPERTWSIYDLRRGSIPPMFSGAIQSGLNSLVTRPLDKMDHYIKRCIGLPGDSLQIRSQQVYINGKKGKNPENVQFMYSVLSPNAAINTRDFTKWAISTEDRMQQSPNAFYLVLNNGQKAKIKAMDPSIKIEKVDVGKLYGESGRLFPNDALHFGNWTRDDFGPIYIPKAGAKVALNEESIALYQRIIQVYEGHQLRIDGNKFYIDGKLSTHYTIEQNYYWMMGDNRHNSEDSRFWGFVPETHVVGKPLFIWMSFLEGSPSKGIVWNRIFTRADTK